ncbi:hypothetical protein HK101_005738 [Irineochytrium annulatum]|nr:hypothetical protein HK101_005738 [Irineochytrium annulatum]
MSIPFEKDEGYEEEGGWTDEQRGEFAFQLLLTVSSSTLASVTNRLIPLLQRDFISLLPYELAIHILSYTDAQTLGRAGGVSRKWKDVCSDNAIWRILYRKNGWTVNERFLDSWNQARATIPVGSSRAGSGSAKRSRANSASASIAAARKEFAGEEGLFPYEADPDSGYGEDAGEGVEIPLPKGGRAFTARDHFNGDQSSSAYFSGGTSVPTSSWASHHGADEDHPMGMPESCVSEGSMFEGARGRAAAMLDDDSHMDTCGSLEPEYQMDNLALDSSADEGVPVDSKGKRPVIRPTPEREMAPFTIADVKNGVVDRHSHLNWKYIYYQRYILELNWKGGDFIVRDFSGHSEAIYCLQFDEDKIVKTIKIWDTKTGACRNTLTGHKASVLCLQYNSDYIISGSSDATIIVWDILSCSILRKLRGHTESVLNLRFDSQYTVSCSKDKTVKIWNTRTGDLLRTLRGHRAAVNAIQFKNGLVVSASGDRNIKVWSMETGEGIRTLAGHTRGIACIQFDGSIIVSGSSDKTIKIWDVHTGTQLNTLSGHTDLVRTLQFVGNRVVSGSYDKTLKVWDLQSGALLLDMKIGGHTSRVFKLQFNDTKIVSCSQDQA